MKSAMLPTVANEVFMQEIVSSRHVGMPTRHLPAPEASGPLSNTTSAQSLSCELSMKSSASLSVLLSATPDQRSITVPQTELQSCHRSHIRFCLAFLEELGSAMQRGKGSRDCT